MTHPRGITVYKMGNGSPKRNGFGPENAPDEVQLLNGRGVKKMFLLGGMKCSMNEALIVGFVTRRRELVGLCFFQRQAEGFVGLDFISAIVVESESN